MLVFLQYRVCTKGKSMVQWLYGILPEYRMFFGGLRLQGLQSRRDISKKEGVSYEGKA